MSVPLKTMDIPRNWTFEKGDIAAAFDRHVREQLPWYDLATQAVVHAARHYLPDSGLVYDIGASTGNIGRAMESLLDQRRAIFVPIEKSREMAEVYDGPGRGRLQIADCSTFPFEEFDVAILFLTLMFLPIAIRGPWLNSLLRKCRRGGVVIVFDKTMPASGYEATVLWRLALAGKVAAGVDPADIVAKELSLGGVQRSLDPAMLPAAAIEFFRFGDFAGWLVPAHG